MRVPVCILCFENILNFRKNNGPYPEEGIAGEMGILHHGKEAPGKGPLCIIN